ncbi:esterase-like activity of phytase family protein [Paraburkholderia bengalensis]|uniref:Esterase-like activity of phytase family protein n=1 Tax=Paraburkholderia bengalensis TaxID=2747562 RepID=A0ABU8J2G7_9BURK
MLRSRLITRTVIGAIASLAALAAAPAAHAKVELIAIGKLDGNLLDKSKETSGKLENGVPGNLLGGLGSGIGYAGCHTFLAVPDRGPNAVSYNAAIDDTASYINRFQTLRLHLEEAAKGAALPFTLTPKLVDTTLLHTSERLAYGTGAAFGVPNGAPKLNRDNHTNYFTGRSDNLDPTHLSTYPFDARFDPESIRVANDGASVFISDEYGPYVYRFDRKSGRRIATYALPDAFAVSALSPVGNDEISMNTSGRVANKGMEGLAISPDGTTLFGAMQSPLIQDGGTNGQFTRIVKIDIRTGRTAQFAYPLTNIGTPSKPKWPTISDVLAVNDHELLVDERDGKGLGDDSTAVFKQIFRIDLTGAQDVSHASGQSGLQPYAVQKTLFLNVVDALTGAGYSANDIPAKIEGIAFGPDVIVRGVKKHTLFVANDNDFLGTITDTSHPAGIANPNQFFVFAIDDADLPDYVAQRLPGVSKSGHDHDGVCTREDDRDDDHDHDGHGH